MGPGALPAPCRWQGVRIEAVSHAGLLLHAEMLSQLRQAFTAKACCVNSALAAACLVASARRPRMGANDLAAQLHHGRDRIAQLDRRRFQGL